LHSKVKDFVLDNFECVFIKSGRGILEESPWVSLHLTCAFVLSNGRVVDKGASDLGESLLVSLLTCCEDLDSEGFSDCWLALFRCSS